MNTVQRVLNFNKRNKDRLLRQSLLSLALRVYPYKGIRMLTRLFFRIREPARWGFIVGCYNSGTTILRELIGAHPMVSVLPAEGYYFTSILKPPEDLGWTRMWAQCEDYVTMPPKIEPQKAQELKKDWSPWWDKIATVFVEKSVANIARMEWLDLNFSGAYFIGIIRNGYCASEGIRRRSRARGSAFKLLGQEVYPIEMAGEQWVVANERMLEYGKRLSHFKLIFYEELAHNPVHVLKDIWEFLGLEIPPVEQISEKLIIADRTFEVSNMNPKCLSNLSAEDIERLNKIIADMQKRLGYTVLSPGNHGESLSE